LIPGEKSSQSEISKHWYSVIDASGNRHYGFKGAMAICSASPVLWIFSEFCMRFKMIENIFRSIYRIGGLIIFYYTEAFTQTKITVNNKPSRKSHSNHTCTAFLRGLKKLFIELIAILFVCYIIWWNLTIIDEYEYGMPANLKEIGGIFRFELVLPEHTPSPIRDDGWFIIPAVLANKKEVDLFKDGDPISFYKPHLVSEIFPSHRWRVFLMNLHLEKHQEVRLHYGRYLCREWNWWDRHTEEYGLVTFRIIYQKEQTMPNYKIKPTQSGILWNHYC